jgi:DNA-binding LytR/AlgR family response regulator
MQTSPDFLKKDADSEHTAQDSFFIRNHHQLIRVKWMDIHWLHADGNYCHVVTASRKYAVKSSMKKLASRLPLDLFLRIHKAYIIRIDSIEKIDTKDNVVTIGDQMLPIGRMYKERLLQQLDII